MKKHISTEFTKYEWILTPAWHPQLWLQVEKQLQLYHNHIVTYKMLLG